MPLTDTHGREHDYLRISVTDRCNLRCIYCMGEEGIELIPHADILTYEEIMEVVAAGVSLGITKIRITGGEPLVRKNLIDLISQIAAIPQVTDLSMTTNGVLLPQYSAALKKAGLQRVNISLDSLNSKVYHAITRCGTLQQVLKGIDAALQYDLQPVKINTVLMKGINENEVLDFLQLAVEKPLHIRFIEYMPFGDHDNHYRERYLPLSYVLETADQVGLKYQLLRVPGGAGPAESYILENGRGSIGLIHPISRHFCSSCNRLRLTPDGNLKACLYWQDEKPVRPALGSLEKTQQLITDVLKGKPAEHRMSSDGICHIANSAPMRPMSKTGG